MKLKQKRIRKIRWYWYGWTSADPKRATARLEARGKAVMVLLGTCQGEQGWDIWYRPAKAAANG